MCIRDEKSISVAFCSLRWVVFEVAIGPVTGHDSHSYRSGTQRFSKVRGRLHWEGYDSPLALGFTGKAIIRR